MENGELDFAAIDQKGSFRFFVSTAVRESPEEEWKAEDYKSDCARSPGNHDLWRQRGTPRSGPENYSSRPGPVLEIEVLTHRP